MIKNKFEHFLQLQCENDYVKKLCKIKSKIQIKNLSTSIESYLQFIWQTSEQYKKSSLKYEVLLLLRVRLFFSKIKFCAIYHRSLGKTKLHSRKLDTSLPNLGSWNPWEGARWAQFTRNTSQERSSAPTSIAICASFLCTQLWRHGSLRFAV